MSKPVTFGLIIKEARVGQGYTQNQLATFVGINTSCLSQIENDNYNFLLQESAIEKIADYLHLNGEELMFLTGQLPSVYQDVVKRHYRFLPGLFFRFRSNPQYADKFFKRMNI